MAKDWEDYVLAGLVVLGGLASFVQRDSVFFLVFTGAGLFAKALKDIREARATERKQRD